MDIPSPAIILNDICQRIDWRALFGNDHPVELDLGAGDGGFALAYARQHPEINLLAVELLPRYARRVQSEWYDIARRNLAT